MTNPPPVEGALEEAEAFFEFAWVTVQNERWNWASDTHGRNDDFQANLQDLKNASIALGAAIAAARSGHDGLREALALREITSLPFYPLKRSWRDARSIAREALAARALTPEA